MTKIDTRYLQHGRSCSQLIIAHAIFNLRGGGAETQLRLLVGEMAKAGHKTFIYCANDDGRADYHRDVNIACYPRRHRFDFSILSNMIRFLEESRPQVLHVWLPASVSIPAMLAALWCGVPVLFSYRNRMFFHRPLAIIEYVTAFFLAKRIVSNNVITQSSRYYRWLYNFKRGIEIPNAVALSGEVSISTRKLESVNCVTFAFSGRITSQKNWRVLLQAVEDLPERPCWSLHLYGAGEEQNELLTFLRIHRYRDRIFFYGFVEDLHQRLSKCDAIVIPSLYEGMPNILLEGLALGLLCVPSRIPAHLNILDTEYQRMTFNPHSVQELRTILRRVLNRDREVDLDKLRELGFAISSNYTKEELCASYCDVYQSIGSRLRTEQ